ncbi:MAG: proteasome-type protease, partial [bacterium]|nr:proteasome-type protease [bacterium]
DTLFTMTSGLRSVRDKTLTYLNDVVQQRPTPAQQLYEFVNMFGDQLRRVRQEDGPSLAASNLSFNLHAIIGGRLQNDYEPQLFYVYPEGNWIEAAVDSPYFIIGRTTYGRPILDRLLTFESSLSTAVALALLAFDATQTSVTDVGCPIDVAVLPTGASHPTLHRFQEEDIIAATRWWSQTLTNSLAAMPMDWAAVLLNNNEQHGL